MGICKKECEDVDHFCYFPKTTGLDKKIRILLISESMPKNKKDYYDAKGEPLFLKNTNLVFNKAGRNFITYADYLENGIYLTTAIKCRKQGYLVKAKTIEYCSYILENEIAGFVNLKVVLLMGDFAIKAVNYIWKRKTGKRIIPSGSTYKIRNGVFQHEGIRFLPSYTQTGESFGLEKSKVTMIEEDVKTALTLIG